MTFASSATGRQTVFLDLHLPLQRLYSCWPWLGHAALMLTCLLGQVQHAVHLAGVALLQSLCTWLPCLLQCVQNQLVHHCLCLLQQVQIEGQAPGLGFPSCLSQLSLRLLQCAGRNPPGSPAGLQDSFERTGPPTRLPAAVRATLAGSHQASLAGFLMGPASLTLARSTRTAHKNACGQAYGSALRSVC